MRVILDTNIVVSAFLSPNGKPAVILGLVLSRSVEICINAAILSEYIEVLSRSKFTGKIHRSAIIRFFEIVRSFGFVVSTFISGIDMPDEADRKFYDAAVSANALLVTGNKKHYPCKSFVCDPGEFLFQYQLRLNAKP